MCCKVFRHLRIQCLLLDKQCGGILRDIGIRHCHRIAFHIAAADIEEPHQVIQLGQKQCIGTVLCHLLSGLCEFLFHALTSNFLVQYRYFSGRKIRSVRPDAVCKIFLIRDTNLRLCQYLFVFFTVHCCNDSAVETQGLTLLYILLQELFDGRNTFLQHAEQFYSCSFQFCLCLNEISAVGPQSGAILPY